MTSMFQQRHFEALATLMQDACPEKHWNPNKRAQWEVIRNRMVELFAQEGRTMTDRLDVLAEDLAREEIVRLQYVEREVRHALRAYDDAPLSGASDRLVARLRVILRA